MQESGEMYLETILILAHRKDPVRSIDVAEEMKFSKPSVSRAVARLKRDGYLSVSDAGHITLTEKGQAIAEKIYERHVVLTQVLTNLGIDEETAAADACKIEHDISDKSFEAMKRFVKPEK